MIPIILSGGSGSRLWPLSRSMYPKQFIPLFGQDSLFKRTIFRFVGGDFSDPVVICNHDHRFLVAESLRETGVKGSEIILEPVGRNTAPAIALSALSALRGGKDPVLLVLPADHVINRLDEFYNAIRNAEKLAEDGHIVTFGALPAFPHTGYGYIKHNGKACGEGYEVEQFCEKPDLSTAQKFCDSGEYYWNSGMFAMRASVYLEELKAHAPDIHDKVVEAHAASRVSYDFFEVDKEIFSQCRSESIDYAIMEKTKRAIVLPINVDWSDLGTWASLWLDSEKDEHDNVVYGDVQLINTKNSMVYGGGKHIALVGLENVVVVDTKDALLVINKEDSECVKDVVNRLKADNREEYLNHREVYRPWGKYDSIDFGSRDQVKRITVNPGAKLSVQMHHHRAEHWVVVRGTAKVTNGDRTFLVAENESTYIPLGTIHSLENPGVIPLELIEVQTGEYLGEDDIVRFDDIYGRQESN